MHNFSIRYVTLCKKTIIEYVYKYKIKQLQ